MTGSHPEQVDPELARALAGLGDLDLTQKRAEAVAAHLDSLLQGANALSRFVDQRPGLPLFQPPA